MSDPTNDDELPVTPDAHPADPDTDVLPGVLPGGNRAPHGEGGSGSGDDTSTPPLGVSAPGTSVIDPDDDSDDAGQGGDPDSRRDSAAGGHEKNTRADAPDGALSPGSTATGSPTSDMS